MKDEKIEKVPFSQNSKPNQKQNFELVQDSNDTLKIKRYLGNDTNVTIPSEYNGKKVTMIGKAAFRGTNISSITLPISVKEIGDSVFQDCYNLTHVILNEGLEKIGSYAFEGANISSITFPSSIKEFGINAFSSCYNLSKVTLNEGLEKICSTAFWGANISSITIPSSVKEIGDYVFKNCSKLKEIKVDSNNETYDSRNNCNAIIETETNTLISGCKNTNIPQDIKKIGIGAFSETKISSITIPSSVKEIENRAFENCSNLSKITLNEGLEKIGWNSFERTKISSITIPSSVKEINNRAFENCSDLKKVICKVPKDKITWKWSDLEIDESIVEYA